VDGKKSTLKRGSLLSGQQLVHGHAQVNGQGRRLVLRHLTADPLVDQPGSGIWAADLVLRGYNVVGSLDGAAGSGCRPGKSSLDLIAVAR